MNNPFEKLKALRDSLPEGPAPAAAPPPKDPVEKALRQKVVVRMERAGRGGRTITRVAGIVLPGDGLETFTREMKRALGCGASIEEGDIILQGDLRGRAADWLEQRGARNVVRA